ncbi:universal stress protein UspA [Paraburkholderia terrae]|uniref:Universal stress protein UspA n=2 Tax=Paraburkholderia terrae TaxID=311230 RepID=A0ABN6JYQ0_9BURK|nr:universal stress protein UspA [Paraburkholderia terrae]
MALRVIARNHGHLLRARSENMFKHLLVPTDGSVLSEEAIRMAVGLAKEFDAKITGIHAIPEFHLLTYDTEMLADTRAEYAQHAKNHAERYLAFIERAATDAAVPCDTTWVESDQPYDAIIRTAQERHCDLIVIASHGRRGVKGLLIGSETQKVLIHSRIPVLVCRGQ